MFVFNVFLYMMFVFNPPMYQEAKDSGNYPCYGVIANDDGSMPDATDMPVCWYDPSAY
jgi:hypothetical protein